MNLEKPLQIGRLVLSILETMLMTQSERMDPVQLNTSMADQIAQKVDPNNHVFVTVQVAEKGKTATAKSKSAMAKLTMNTVVGERRRGLMATAMRIMTATEANAQN